MFFPPLDIIFIFLETLREVIIWKGLVIGGLDAKQAAQIMRMLFPVSAHESRPTPPAHVATPTLLVQCSGFGIGSNECCH